MSDDMCSAAGAAGPQLGAFARYVVETMWETLDVDGGDLQDRAIELGIIVPVPGGFDPDKHHSEWNSERGDPWYVLCAALEKTP